jgi:hypothetical protein
MFAVDWIGMFVPRVEAFIIASVKGANPERGGVFGAISVRFVMGVGE